MNSEEIDPFDPSELPPIEKVQVRVRMRWGKTVDVLGKAAQTITNLWRRLPPGKQYRCHNPVYELRFFNGNTTVCLATVCWECHNIYGILNERRFRYQFDGAAKISQKLLAEVQRINPGPSESDIRS